MNTELYAKCGLTDKEIVFIEVAVNLAKYNFSSKSDFRLECCNG